MADPMERFWEKVDRRGPDDCWRWTGAANRTGYGRFHHDGGNRFAHRIAWLLAHDRQPQGVVMHTCDNPPCVNPAHLREGTMAENNADMMAKGRHRVPVGEAHSKTPLKRADVEYIRNNCGWRGGAAALAKKFGISHASISAIKNGKSWKTI